MIFAKSKFRIKIVILAGLEAILGPLGTILVSPSLFPRPRRNFPGGCFISLFHLFSHLNFTQLNTTQLILTHFLTLRGLHFNRNLASFFFSTPHRTSTSLNLTPLNSTQLNSLFDPPRPPFWSLLGTQIDSRSAPNRLLTPYFSKNVTFHEM